jgi:hypothetical protein
MKTILDFFRFVAFLKGKLLIRIRFVLQAIKYVVFYYKLAPRTSAKSQPPSSDVACQRSCSPLAKRSLPAKTKLASADKACRLYSD